MPDALTPSTIRTIRERLGMTQTEFARRLGVRQASVSDWERGRRRPMPIVVRAIENLAREKPT